MAAMLSGASSSVRIVPSLGLRMVLVERGQANTDELEHGRALIVSVKEIGAWKLGVGESGGLPELARGGATHSATYAEGSGWCSSPGRQAVGCSGRGGLFADLDGEIETFGPELQRAGRTRVEPQRAFLEDGGGEPVLVAKRARQLPDRPGISSAPNGRDNDKRQRRRLTAARPAWWCP